MITSFVHTSPSCFAVISRHSSLAVHLSPFISRSSLFLTYSSLFISHLLMYIRHLPSTICLPKKNTFPTSKLYTSLYSLNIKYKSNHPLPPPTKTQNPRSTQIPIVPRPNSARSESRPQNQNAIPRATTQPAGLLRQMLLHTARQVVYPVVGSLIRPEAPLIRSLYHEGRN